MDITRYVGRFAPSPTGDLHFGSLIAAVASYCDCKNRGGIWYLRIDDIDPPRSVKGSAASIQDTLDTFGFEWNGPVKWQSNHLADYEEALHQLSQLDVVFKCTCSRKQLRGYSVYPGNCRKKRYVPNPSGVLQCDNMFCLRGKMTGRLSFIDSIQGLFEFNLEKDIGDTILWRRDGLVSYALACAVDDASISHVVRGADLLHSTANQVAIMQLLGLNTPKYAHFPVAINTNGDKLSKHAKSAPVRSMATVPTLLTVWNFLGQAPIEPENLSDFWLQAIQHWDISKVPAILRKQP